jgi:Skp family chaperone for outer membrane proteins
MRGPSYIAGLPQRSETIMLHRRLLHLSLMIPAALLVGVSAGRVQGGQDPANANGAAQPKIVVVDIDRVMKAHAPFEKKLEDLRTRKRGEYDTKIDAIEKNINEKRSLLNTLEPGSLQHAIAESELRYEMMAADNATKLYSAALDEDAMKVQHEMFKELDALVERFARLRKLEIVLRYRPLPADNGKPGDVQKRMQVIPFRDVLWHSGVVDVTDDLIQFAKQ